MIGLAILISTLASPVELPEEPVPPPAQTVEVMQPSRSIEVYGFDTTTTAFRAARFGLEVVGGGVGWLAVGAATTIGLCLVSPADGWCVLGGIAGGAVLGGAFGAPLGAWVVGYLLDGTGSAWAMLGGGLVMGALATAVMRSGNSAVFLPTLAFGLLLPAIIFEYTSSGSRVNQERGASWMVAPTIGRDSAGLAFAMVF